MAPRSKVGRYRNHSGYWMIYNLLHPRSQQNGYVREHILIAERALRKPLPNTVPVHHYGDIGDNTKLVICENAAYHALLHQRTVAYRATGNPNARKCVWCGRHGNPANPADRMTLRRRADRVNGNGQAYHRACAAKYTRRLRAK